MVFYFTSNVVSPPATLYMGIDKHENEELIRWGWPEDVWFHVDDLSSAHVYLRLKAGESLDDIPAELLEDCAQLVKANSIQGNKQNQLRIVYTAWSNLHKTGDMAVGQVGFHNNKAVRRLTIERRVNEVVNRLNKTRTEKTVDEFRLEREQRDQAERDDKKRRNKEDKQREKDEVRRKEEEKRLMNYSDLFEGATQMTTNRDQMSEDDFM